MAANTALIMCSICKLPRATCWAMGVLPATKTVREDAVVRFIAHLAFTRKKPFDFFKNISVDLSQRDLALKLGITGPGAGRILKKLVSRGILKCENQRKEYQTDAFTYELVGSSQGIDVCTHTYLYKSNSEFIYINNLNNKYLSFNKETSVQTSVPETVGIDLVILPGILRHEVCCKSPDFKKILTDDSVRFLLLLKSHIKLPKELIQMYTGMSHKRFRSALKILRCHNLVVGDNNGFELSSRDIFALLDSLVSTTNEIPRAEHKRNKTRKQQTDYRQLAKKIGVIEKSELPKVRNL